MHAAELVNHSAKTISWPGRVLSTIVVLFMIFDAVLHILKPAAVVLRVSSLMHVLRAQW